MLGLVDVTDFWAVGDGTTDCRIPVQNAIAFAKVNKNAGIYFPSGDYKFSRANPLGIEGAIDISGVDGFIIAGSGARTRLFQDTPPTQDWHLIRIFNTADRVVVRDLMLDGSYLGPATHPGVTAQHHLIRIGAGSRRDTRTHQVHITNCYLKNCRGDAINIIGGTNAVGVLTLGANPTQGETVTVGTTQYRFVNPIAATADVLIGGTLAQSLDNLAAAIVGGPGAGTVYHAGTVANPGVGDADHAAGTNTLIVRSRIPTPLALAETLASGAWDAATATFIDALTDEVLIDHNYIYETYRSGIGVQRGCRKIVIDSNVIIPNRRGVIDFEPTGANVDTEDWADGNSPQQCIITNNVLVALKRGNTVASLSGIGARDRNKYSLIAHNLCLGGGFEAINVGPLIIDSNIIVGSRRTGGSAVGLIRLRRGCQDIVVSNNYLERPVPEEGETVASNTLEFRTNQTDSATQQPRDGESVRIGTTTYTFRTQPAAASDVLIGATLAQTSNNLVAAIVGGPATNAAITSATSDGDSVRVTGQSVTTQTTVAMAAGFWTAGRTLANSAGPLIELLENGGVQPLRVTVANNHGRQHMQSSGIVLTSVSNAMVQANQLHCFHSGQAGNGISHTSITSSDQVHIHDNHLMRHGMGRWNHGIHLAQVPQLGHSSVCDNAIDGAAVGIRYDGGQPSAIPTVSDNRVSDSPGGAYQLPTPTCTGGNHGGVAQYEGADAPTFAAEKGSTYLNRSGNAGTSGAPGTLRFLRASATTWVPLIDG